MTWRCAICRMQAEAADARQAERALVAHWRAEHLSVPGSWKERYADHAADA